MLTQKTCFLQWKSGFLYINEYSLKKLYDLFLNAKNPDTRGYYMNWMETYKKLLEGLLFHEEDEQTVYTYFLRYWWKMVHNHDFDKGLMEWRHNFDWLNWYKAKTVDKTWEQWVVRHQVVNLVNWSIFPIVIYKNLCNKWCLKIFSMPKKINIIINIKLMQQKLRY